MILTPEEAELYYKLHWALLAHTNRRLDIVSDATTTDDVMTLVTSEKMDIREALYEAPGVLESFITENPEGFSADELAIVASWRHRVSGNFYIARYLKRYTIFLSATEPERLYAVLGLQDPIEDTFAGHPLPIYVQTVLLPFKDKVIYDGLLSTYNIYFGGGIRSSVKATYNRIKRRDGFIEQLVGVQILLVTRTNVLRKNRPAMRFTLIIGGNSLQIRENCVVCPVIGRNLRKRLT